MQLCPILHQKVCRSMSWPSHHRNPLTLWPSLTCLHTTSLESWKLNVLLHKNPNWRQNPCQMTTYRHGMHWENQWDSLHWSLGVHHSHSQNWRDREHNQCSRPPTELELWSCSLKDLKPLAEGTNYPNHSPLVYHLLVTRVHQLILLPSVFQMSKNKWSSKNP